MNKSIAELTEEMNATDNPVTRSVIKDIICSRALELEKGCKYLLSFAPKGSVPKGLSPHFYHTRSYESDCLIQSKVNEIEESFN